MWKIICVVIFLFGAKFLNDLRVSSKWVAQAGEMQTKAAAEEDLRAKLPQWESTVAAYEKANSYSTLKGDSQKAWYRAQEEVVVARKNILDAILEESRVAIGKRQWDVAKAKLSEASNYDPKSPLIQKMETRLTESELRATKNAELATKEFAELKDADQGVYDSSLIKKLDKLVALSPDDQKIADFVAKIRSNPRTILVPEDVKTLARAAELARDGDQIKLGAGKWNEPLIVSKKITVTGAGPEQTFVTVASSKGSALLVTADAQISGIEFRGSGTDTMESRFAVAEIAGANVKLDHCRFSGGAGHGIWIHDQSHVGAMKCVAAKNAWDGWAVDHADAKLTECETTENLRHGLSAGRGALVNWQQGLIAKNGVNGVLSNSEKSVNIVDSSVQENKEFGAVWLRGSGEIRGGSVEKNQLAGIGLRKGVQVAIHTTATGNTQAELLLETGATNPGAEMTNPKAVVLEGADFSTPEPDPQTPVKPCCDEHPIEPAVATQPTPPAPVEAPSPPAAAPVPALIPSAPPVPQPAPPKAIPVTE